MTRAAPALLFDSFAAELGRYATPMSVVPHPVFPQCFSPTGNSHDNITIRDRDDPGVVQRPAVVFASFTSPSPDRCTLD